MDAISLKNAVSSAVDVMQGLGSSVCSMLSKVNNNIASNFTFHIYLSPNKIKSLTIEEALLLVSWFNTHIHHKNCTQV